MLSNLDLYGLVAQYCCRLQSAERNSSLRVELEVGQLPWRISHGDSLFSAVWRGEQGELCSQSQLNGR